MTIEIPLSLPSFHQYMTARKNGRFEIAIMQKDVEMRILPYLCNVPKIERPVEFEFNWIESSPHRNLDNVAFAKKFILDALVRLGKISDKSCLNIRGFKDRFSFGDTTSVIVTIKYV